MTVQEKTLTNIALKYYSERQILGTIKCKVILFALDLHVQRSTRCLFSVPGKAELTDRHTAQSGGYIIPFQRHKEAICKQASLETQ